MGKFNSVNVYPPHGYIDLENYCGSDLTVVNAARVSLAKHSKEYSLDDQRLLRYLIREKHGSPFEHNHFRFRLRAPMIVWWEWVRHRMASYNLESGRYVELRQHFFLPAQARIQVGRPGAYTFETGTDDQTKWLRRELKQSASDGFGRYLDAIKLGIAKEQARLFLPVTLYVEGLFSANARSIMNFVSLRNDPQAMQEIHDYADALERIWANFMPDTHKAFVEFGRVAP